LHYCSHLIHRNTTHFVSVLTMNVWYHPRGGAQNRPFRNSAETCMSTTTEPERDQSFAETAMRLGGKSEEEARRMGAVDKADEQVESLFAPQYQTSNSPVHKAVWEGRTPLELFTVSPLPPAAPCDPAMGKSLEIVRARRE